MNLRSDAGSLSWNNPTRGDAGMARYQVSAMCNACGDLHTTGITVALNDGPTKKQSIADAFPGGKNSPAQLTAQELRVYCQRTGRHYTQKDKKKVYLVPVG